MWCGGACLAARRHLGGKLAGLDDVETGWKVNQHPMEEIHARQVGRYGASLLIDVITLTWYVGVVAADGE